MSGRNEQRRRGELASWVASFRSAAEADSHAILTAHLRRFDVQVDPDLLLEGTIDFVSAIAAFATIERRSVTDFLTHRHTTEHSERRNLRRHVYVFGRGVARVLADTRLRALEPQISTGCHGTVPARWVHAFLDIPYRQRRSECGGT